MTEHVNDPFVQRAKAEGLRARAAYKLTEIDDKDKLLRPGMVVVDLGAFRARGVSAATRVGEKGRVFALDLLPMEPIRGVEFMQGDFHDGNFVVLFPSAAWFSQRRSCIVGHCPQYLGYPEYRSGSVHLFGGTGAGFCAASLGLRAFSSRFSRGRASRNSARRWKRVLKLWL